MNQCMMNREFYLKNIADNLAVLCYKVQILGTINLYDINIVSETFYARLINLIEDYCLVNANSIKKNASAIDLIDIKNRVSIQVTSDNSSTKIKHTLKEFCDKELYKKYDRLIFLILTKKRLYRTRFNTQGLFSFDIKSDIWDVNELMKRIDSLPTEKLREINDYLELEFEKKSKNQTEASEIETIFDLIEFITSNRQTVFKIRDTIIDPNYKINERFKEFADNLKSQYMNLLPIYEPALTEIEQTKEIDNAQEIITKIYLQDLSIEYLDNAGNDPIKALNNLVSFFQNKLEGNGKEYDRAAIKFYLIHEMIKCNIFPNEAGEKDVN